MGTFSERVRLLGSASHNGLIALAAACGARVVPVFDEYWVGSHTPAVAQAVEYGWAVASGESVADEYLRKCAEDISKFVDYYNEESIGILASSVTVALRVVESVLAASDEDVVRAAARACGSALHVAVLVDGLVEGRERDRPGDAELEERTWQQGAIERVRARLPVGRDMFSDLGPTPPAWWNRYLAAPQHI